MSSETIVVFVFMVLGIDFVIWVRKNSHDYDLGGQADTIGQESKAHAILAIGASSSGPGAHDPWPARRKK